MNDVFCCDRFRNLGYHYGAMWKLVLASAHTIFMERERHARTKTRLKKVGGASGQSFKGGWGLRKTRPFGVAAYPGAFVSCHTANKLKRQSAQTGGDALRLIKIITAALDYTGIDGEELGITAGLRQPSRQDT
ncbi:hypothetical protein [Agrobacterium tumefaciens]|uniref:hypothetical protein n=1 Tax=Agrobacterium tumefaciens TaxID=358 RepID=UPI00287C4A54|nr:hypothetical protein [Agrobacterium tumefaciens]MDS7593963.1 hypothetical protein [Agrobacterium tumefaciens]